MRNLIIAGLLLSGATTFGASAFEVTTLTDGWSLSSSCGVFSTMNDITVPSTIIAAQIQNEMRKPEKDRQLPFSDPLYGKNLDLFNASGYQACPVVYSRPLDVSIPTAATAASEAIHLLRLHGVNYNANLTINGKQFLSDQSVIGGIRRYTLDVSEALNPANAAADAAPPRLRRRGGAVAGGIKALLDAKRGKAEKQVASTNQLTISLQPPVNPRGTDFTYSFLDWNPLPADFNGGLWRSASLLSLTQPLSMDGGLSDDKSNLFLWSDGFSVTTTLGDGGKNPKLASSVAIDMAIQCYPLERCEAILLNGANGNGADDAVAAQNLIAKQIVITTDYPTAPLSEIRGSTGACRISTAFARFPSAAASDVDKTIAGQPFVEGRVVCTVTDIVEPLLWYPFRRAYEATTNTDKPHLFHLSLSVADTKDSTGATLIPIGEPKKNFGLRQITSDVSDQNARQLFINGEFILIAGAGWSPDLFMRVDEGTGAFASSSEGYKGKLLRQLELTKDMGVNLIRLEGKWENELFFNLCDEMGILVLPGIECCSSWQNWNLWTDVMTDIAKTSIRDQVRRLTSHPAMIAFLTSSDEIAPAKVEQLYVDVYKSERWSAGVIPAACAGTSTISGPTGVKMSGPYSWVPPYYFLANSDGNQYQLGGAWGFLTEGGPGEAPMTYNAWKMTVPAEHQWEEPSENNSEEPSLSDWWNAHAGLPKGKFGTIRRFTEPLNARFGGAASAKEFLYKSQLMNYEGIRAMYEAYTRNKIYNATGVVQWMLNNAHPSNIWHLYDYYLYGGGGYYGAKAALRPVQMVLNTVDGSVAIVANDFNDHFGHKKGTAKRYLNAEWFVYRMPQSREAAATKAPTIIASSGSERFDVNTFSHNTVLFMSTKINFTDVEEDLGVNETYMVRLVYIVERDTPIVAAAKGEQKKADDAKLSSTNYVVDNWYWLSTRKDIVDWNYSGPSPNLWTACLQWADFTSLEKYGLYPTPAAAAASSSVTPSAASLASPIKITYTKVGPSADGDKLHWDVTVTNTAPYFVFGVQLAAYSGHAKSRDGTEHLEVGPSFWEDNYFMMMPNKSRTLRLTTLAFEDYTDGKLAVTIERIEAVTYNDIIAEREQRYL